MRQLILVLACLSAASACQKTLPTAPTNEQEQAFGLAGLIVYEHINFGGESAVITEDVGDLRDYHGPCTEITSDFSGASQVNDSWNDCISSVRIAAGWKATLYRDDGYRDDSIEVTTDIPDLRTVRHDCPKGGLNDCVTSIRVTRPR